MKKLLLVATARPGDPKQRGRRALAWGLLFFLLGQFALALAIDRRFPELRDPEFGCRIQRLRQRLAKCPESALVVIMLGSSRTTAGFQAGILESDLAETLGRPAVAFNFGLTGAGPLGELLQCRRLLAEGIRPDLLLVELTPAFLSAPVAAAEVGRIPTERLWLSDVALLGSIAPALEQTPWAWWQSALVPAYANRFAILSRFCPPLIPNARRMDWAYQIDRHGCLTTPRKRWTTSEKDAAMAVARREYAGALQHFVPGGLARDALEALIRLCRQHDVPLAFVLMPETPAFRGWYGPAAREETRRIIAFLQDQPEAAVIDAREWMADQAFADAHHLLPMGASEFTERLARELIGPGTGSSRPRNEIGDGMLASGRDPLACNHTRATAHQAVFAKVKDVQDLVPSPALWLVGSGR